MRINRYLAACGLGSRRAVEQLVLDGRVAIAGTVVRDLGAQVAEDAVVTVDGRRAAPPAASRVILFHKPVNVMTTRDDPEGRRTIYDLLPAGFERFAYAGRLDFASRGLLVLTDDGELLHRLTHPSWDHPKHYRVELDAPLTAADLVRIREGSIELPDELPLKPVSVQAEGRLLRLELREGRNRQIRRMMEALGREVLDLCRVSVGLWTLGTLGTGEWRELTPAEIDPMRRLLALPSTADAPRPAVAPESAKEVAPNRAPQRPFQPTRPKPRR